MRSAFLLLLVTTVFFTSNVSAGKLDDFEADVTSKESKYTVDNYADDDPGESLGDFFFDLLFDILFDSLFSGNETETDTDNNTGWHAADNRQLENIDNQEIIYSNDKPNNGFLGGYFNRHSGERLAPFAKIDLVSGRVESKIDMEDYRVEAGYGPLAFFYKKSVFFESAFEDELVLSQYFINYRLLLVENFEIDFGLGDYKISGNDTRHQGAFNTGLLFNFSDSLGLEYRFIGVAGDTINLEDNELSVLWGRRYFALKGGYRWVEGETTALKGPFAGVVLYY